MYIAFLGTFFSGIIAGIPLSLAGMVGARSFLDLFIVVEYTF